MQFLITFNIQGLFQYNLHSLNVVLVPDGIQKLLVLYSEWKYLCNHLCTKAEKHEIKHFSYGVTSEKHMLCRIFLPASPGSGQFCTFLHPSKSSRAEMQGPERS